MISTGVLPPRDLCGILVLVYAEYFALSHSSFDILEAAMGVRFMSRMVRFIRSAIAFVSLW